MAACVGAPQSLNSTLNICPVLSHLNFLTSRLFISQTMDEESETRRNAIGSSPSRYDEPDPRQSLQHVLGTTETPSRQSQSQLDNSGHPRSNSQQKMIWIQEGGRNEGAREYTEDEGSVQNDSYTRAAEVNPSHTMTVAHTRRNANGTIGSVYSGNKIRHLKKDDGIPLWRKDIQHAFLRHVFEDPTPVFTKVSDATRNNTFAEIYIDAMARSSKTSKILKDKLLSDRGAALNMAMVCLLVNVGRMNTTLNCKESPAKGKSIADRSFQFSLRCELSSEPIIPFHPFKFNKIQMRINSFKMHHG